MSKHFFQVVLVFLCAQSLTACSTNPATGENQFTALMSPQQERQVGAQEHTKVLKQYGLYQDKSLQSYVQQVGQKVVQNTERPDVTYQFYLLDSPVVNAFALPGGYIYLTRGLMALSNSESEMAAVMAHEAGHITGRHSAERYSRGVVTTLGAALISAAAGSSGVSQALGLGSDLYIKSYSRGQENQADGLGIRYLNRNGYDPRSMAFFLSNLQADTQLEARIAGQDASNTTDYFSTHPATSERISLAMAEAAKYPQQGTVGRDEYLHHLDGMIYGDSAAQGFVRGQNFYHPQMGFTFSVPPGFEIVNQSHQVLASGRNGEIIVFDMVANKDFLSPMDFLRTIWLQNAEIEQAENIEINGMKAATGAFQGSVNGQSMTVRLISVAWAEGQMARFLMAIPHGLPQSGVEGLQRTSYSFRHMHASEKSSIKPYRLHVVTAKAGDTVASMASRMVFPDFPQDRFRVLNGLKPGENIQPGRLYKIVTD